MLHLEFRISNPNCIVIDQKQIGTSIRSTPATYVGIMDEIRKIFEKYNYFKNTKIKHYN